MRQFLILISVFYGFSSFGWLPASEPVIYWQTERLLVWTDFKGQPSGYPEALALTASAVSYNIGVKNGKLTYEVLSFFNKNQSWTRTRDSAVLKHEQNHFDISEIIARRVRKKITEYVATHNKPDFPSLFKILDKMIDSEFTALQQQYDRETDNGRDRQEQLRWNKNIESELFNLNNYISPKATINLP